MIKEYIKTQKGITIVSLVITIIIMLILSGTLIYNVRPNQNVASYNNMISDINLLEDKIFIYYNKYGNLPTYNTEYTINGITYYEINLQKLENITLNYGKKEDAEDIYLVNDNLKVYYKKGIKKASEMYYTK